MPACTHVDMATRKNADMPAYKHECIWLPKHIGPRAASPACPHGGVWLYSHVGMSYCQRVAASPAMDAPRTEGDLAESAHRKTPTMHVNPLPSRCMRA